MLVSKNSACSFSRSGFKKPGMPVNLLGGGKVGVVNIFGPLYSSKNIIGNIRRFRDDNSIKAIVLRIDSPGGGVAVCQEINEEIYKTREEKKLVIASFGSVSASGGYYIGCAADEIYSNPGTLTGSIGVIMSFFNFSDLFKKIGVDQVTIKAGKYKDVGSMSRKITLEEEALLQGVLDDVHSQFINAIASNRRGQVAAVLKSKKGIEKPTDAEVRNAIVEVADGRIFSGQQAKELGLVDFLGGEDDAIKYAAERSGIKGEPAVVREKKRSSFLEFLTGSEETESHLQKFFFKGMCFLYGE